jgi:hypothetical protein
MGAKYEIGQRVRILRVVDKRKGVKYLELEKYIYETGVLQETSTAPDSYTPYGLPVYICVVRLDRDGSLVSVPEDALERLHSNQ